MPGFSQYNLLIHAVEPDSAVTLEPLKLVTSFKSRTACEIYLKNLTVLMTQKGFPAASIDSIEVDTSQASVWLYVGPAFKFGVLSASAANRKMLEQSGWQSGDLERKPLNSEKLRQLQDKLLDYLENNGYPFARVRLDSIRFDDEQLSATIKIEEGPLYKIDSIRVYGDVKISKEFLQQYLEIRNGSAYRRSKLENISRKLRELPFVQEQRSWNITMLGTGSIINLYLQAKKSSQVNVLLGLLPSNEQTINNKLLLTGEANINLRNALGNGELIGLNWQQLQVKSPRLNLAFQQPYLFGSAFGISSTFDLFKKDSSYLNLNFLLGMQYALPGQQSGRVFVQTLKTNLLTLDTVQLKASKTLPAALDVGSVNLGIDYDFNGTDYRLNPRRGSEIQVTLSAGTRKVTKNNTIVKLQDPAFSFASLYDTVRLKTYQFRVRVFAAHYFQLGKQSALKTALNGALLQSPSLFRNELYQIGGYKLLRGFDEESIFASQYAVGTVEYRYLIGLNAYLFSFIDAGVTATRSTAIQVNNRFAGAGLGLAFETKAGIFNISYAAGKRDDAKFNLRQAKIHLGYVNFF